MLFVWAGRRGKTARVSIDLVRLAFILCKTCLFGVKFPMDFYEAWVGVEEQGVDPSIPRACSLFFACPSRRLRGTARQIWNSTSYVAIQIFVILMVAIL